MTITEQNKELILRWIDARNHNKLEDALAVWAESWHEVLSPNFQSVTRTFPDIHIIVEDIIAEGNT